MKDMYVLLGDKGDKHLINKEGEYIFQEGKVYISKQHINNVPIYISTSTGKKMLLLKASLKDKMELLFKRGAQIIHEKDIGFIMRHFFVNKDMTILESGSGSGHATIFLSLLSKKLVSYERDDRFYRLTKRNLSLFDIENVDLIKEDVINAHYEEEFDLVLWDFKYSSKKEYIEKAWKCLKQGGYVILYLPVIDQVKMAINNLEQFNFIDIKIREILLREWKVNPLRPKNRMLGHTAFVVSGRKF